MNAHPASERSRWKRILLFSLLGPLALALLAAAACAWASWKARAEWRETEAELRGRGENLLIEEMAPPPPPDARNFFAAPIWRELGDNVPEGRRMIDAFDPPLSAGLAARAKAVFPDHAPAPASSATAIHRPSTGLSEALRARSLLAESSDLARRHELAQFILDVLAPGEPTRRLVEKLLDRPEALYPLDYDAGFTMPVPHDLYLLRFSRVYQCLAAAHLELGQSEPAAGEVVVTLRLSQTLQREPILIPLLVRCAMVSTATGTIAQGIRHHAWTPGELRDFDRELRGVDLRPQFLLALRGERGSFNHTVDATHRESKTAEARRQIALAVHGTGPGAKWETRAQLALYPLSAPVDQSYFNRYIQQAIDAASRTGGMRPGDFPRLPAPMDVRFQISHFLSILAGESVEKAFPRPAAAQENILQTRVACALELHWLKNRVYPATLDQLAPAFPVPASVISGQRIQYRREPAGSFRLWSAGWNETNEGGSPAARAGDYTDGDWVWGLPPGATSPRS